MTNEQYNDERNELLSCISDSYKDLNGFRPRFNMDHLTNDDLRMFHNQILTDLSRQLDEETREEIEHYKATDKAMTPSPQFTIGDIFKNLTLA